MDYLARRGLLLAFLWMGVSACGESTSTDSGTAEAANTITPDHVHEVAADSPAVQPRFGGVQLDMPPQNFHVDAGQNARRVALFGDLHIHTTYSFDAFAFGTIATPDDAYRYAQGNSVRHPAGFDVQLSQPLDFYAVTDHAMFLGAVRAAADTTTGFSQQLFVTDLHNLNAPENQNLESVPSRVKAFTTFLPETVRAVASGRMDVEVVNNIARDAWAEIIASAQRHNQPGKFTTFVAYEYTSSTDDRGNLHRNVIFRDADKLPAMPFSRFHSQDPEGLWDWMDGLRTQGIESLAIPHNSNGSNGQMFKLVDWAGDPLDENYAQKRIRNEPLVEVTQVKGTSETHPLLSPNDEWADHEIMPYRVATTLYSEPDGSYARDALRKGLSMSAGGLTNAYEFGMVGASDTHTVAGSFDEDNFFSKVGLLDADGMLRGSIPVTGDTAEILKAAGRVQIKNVEGRDYVSGAYETWSASGLTGVWADENTRDAIYSAFRRKETFATSGPRLRIRLFAGLDLPDGLDGSGDLSAAYAEGVTMGSRLAVSAGTPSPEFYVWAARDAQSAPLQRLQVVKGWVRDGKTHEQVFDVACSDGNKPDPNTGRCPDNGATVDTSDCSITPGVGSAELATYWRDPDFRADEQAFYYARVLENPTCRWSTWDAVRAGVAPRADLAATLQERAWSSPIWTMPE
ncbi:MAG: DUF3604 domain-containing protein [Pseudomonadota bacterium]